MESKGSTLGMCEEHTSLTCACDGDSAEESSAGGDSAIRLVDPLAGAHGASRGREFTVD